VNRGLNARKSSVHRLRHCILLGLIEYRKADDFKLPNITSNDITGLFGFP
jgi:hypothetical protein